MNDLEITRNAYIYVDKEYMKQRNYMVSVKASLDNYCRQAQDADGRTIRIISKKIFREVLRDGLKLGKKKIAAVIKTFVDLGILIDYGESYIISRKDSFLLLEPDTVRFCLDHLQELEFKVYCYLRSKYLQHIELNFVTPFEFTISGKGGLLEVCGYSPKSGNNRRKMLETLKILEKLNLIQISEAYPKQNCDMQYQGWYRTLIRVNDFSNVQEEIIHESYLRPYVEDYIYNDYDRQDQPSPIFLDGKKYLYNKKIFTNNLLLEKMIEDSRNLKAITFALNVQDIPEENIDKLISVEQSWREGQC